MLPSDGLVCAIPPAASPGVEARLIDSSQDIVDFACLRVLDIAFEHRLLLHLLDCIVQSLHLLRHVRQRTLEGAS